MIIIDSLIYTHKDTYLFGINSLIIKVEEP